MILSPVKSNLYDEIGEISEQIDTHWIRCFTTVAIIIKKHYLTEKRVCYVLYANRQESHRTADCGRLL